MELTVQMLRQIEGAPDARGDRPLYPKGWIGQVDGDTAVYLVAMDYAWGVGEWPEEILASLDVVRAIVALFRQNGIEPTQANVTAEIQARLLHMAEEDAAAAASETVSAGDASASLQAPDAAPAKVPASETAGNTKAQRKRA